MISQILKYIIFTIIFGITIYYYINHRNIGCRDKNAINYNSEINIHDKTKCIYKIPGCMDKNAPNYNLYANTSCKEDCTACDLKGNCDLCTHQVDCTNTCPECICKPKVYGCNRDWALNYDKNATIETNCISPDDILKKISIVSGGDCDNCSSRVSIRIGDNYPILGGSYGINVLVLERNSDLTIRYNRNFSTGNYDIENKKFVDFMRRYVFYKDIVIIAVRGDATGRKRTAAWESLGKDNAFIGDPLPNVDTYTSLSLAQKACTKIGSECIGINETPEKNFFLMSYTSKQGVKTGHTGHKRKILFLDRILTDESKKILETLGAKNPDINREGSYILIGSFLNDIYYETYSANADSYFPYMDLESYGCLNINHPYFERIKLDPGKHKMLANTGDIDDDDVDLNRVDVIYRCAQEAIRSGYRVFSVSKTNCYVYKLKDKYKEKKNQKGYDINNYISKKRFLSYDKDYNKNIKVGVGECKVNYHLQPYGNNYDESFYYIKDLYYSGLFSMFYGGQMVQTYSTSKYNGFRRDLGVGIHQAVSTISLSPRAINGKLFLQLTSFKIPKNFKVTLFRNIYIDEDLTKYESYRLSDSEQRVNFFNLNLNNTEGVKIKCMGEDGKEIRNIEYRVWNNIIKNLKIKNNEQNIKIYIYNRPIEENRSEVSQQCMRYGVIVPGWYQDTRYNQQNQCVAPKGKKCCNTKYSQGDKEGEEVLLDGKIILNGKITYTREGSIFAPPNPTDMSWLDFRMNYPDTGKIYVLKGDRNKDIKVNYIVIGDTIKLSEIEEKENKDYSNKVLLTIGREACNVDFENIRSSKEVKDWINNCRDNLDEITTTKWENIGMNNAFSGDPIEDTPLYYNLHDAKLGCMRKGNECIGINKTDDNKFYIMPNNAKVNEQNGYDAYKRSNALFSKPEDRYGYDLIDTYDVRYYKEIQRLKNADYNGKVGYIAIYDKNNEKTRQIEFSVWYHFWHNMRLSSKETYFIVKTVDPEKVPLPKTLTIEGPSTDEQDDNIIYKEYPSIIKSPPEGQGYTPDIGYIIVSKSQFGVTFYEEPEYKGLSHTLNYGRYNLSNDLSFIIQSIKVTIKNCIIRLFIEYNFKVEYAKIIHYVEGKDIRYSNLNNLFDDNVRIKSIIIDKIPFDNIISNNANYDTYNENQIYNKSTYPITMKIKNQYKNYLNTIYDIFKDGLPLYDNDKKMLLIEENKIAFYISGFKIIKGIYINSGGGYSFISKIINNNNRKDVLNILNDEFGCINTYSNNNHIRKIIYFRGKILEMRYTNGIQKFNYKSLSKLSFSGKERYIIIKKTSNNSIGENIRNIMRQRNIIEKKLEEIYGILYNLDFDIQLINIPLAQKYVDLLQTPFISENNRAILNTNFNIQIMDDYGNTTKYVKFYGQKYVINYNINSDNNILDTDINISKHEKYVQIKHRNSYDINNNYEANYSTNMNLRLDFKSIIRSSISSVIQNLMSSIVGEIGHLETRDRKNNIINKYKVEKGKIYKFNELIEQKNMLFNPQEFTIYYYDKLNKLQVILPIKDDLNINIINNVLNYYLYNQNCYIKLFNRKSDLVRIILTKQGKFLSYNEKNKLITLDRYSVITKSLHKNYNYLFKEGNWIDAPNNIDIDLDESQISIQLENGTDIFMVPIDVESIILNYKELRNHLKNKKINLFPSLSNFLEKKEMAIALKNDRENINLSTYISNSICSKMIFKDINNNITKEIDFAKDKILVNMPIQYLELNNQNHVYRLLYNKTEIIRITLPEGMKGIYKYGNENNPTYVNKVVRESDIEAVIYDENNNIIQTTKDYDLHEYIFGVIIDNYSRKYKIEYYPKMNQWKIRLYEQDRNINLIEMYDPVTRKIYDVRDELGNVMYRVNGNTHYIIENNYTNMKVINKDNTAKYYFAMGMF